MSDLIRREDAYAAIRGLTRHIDRIAAIRALPAVQHHVNKTPKSEHDAVNMLTLTAERDRLREALTFYAAPETYQDTFVAEDCECCHRREHPAIEDDNGKVARAALKGESHD